MYTFANAGFVFICGGILGAILEYIYSDIFIFKKIFKTGFFFSIFLPLYGFGFLGAQHVFNASWFNVLNNIYLDVFLKIIILTIMATILEYITGIIYLKIFKTRLWDYSKEKFNIQGIINPLYSFLWMIMATCYYFIFFKPFNLFFRTANGNITYFIVVLIIIIFLIIDFILSTICCLKNKTTFNKLKITYVEFKHELFKLYGCFYPLRLLKGIDIKEYKKDKAKLNKEKSNYLIAN